MVTKYIPTPENRKRAVRGSVEHKLVVYVPPGQKDLITAAAKRAGLPSVSEWIRRLIQKALTPE